jgi:hypothetical protein
MALFVLYRPSVWNILARIGLPSSFLPIRNTQTIQDDEPFKHVMVIGWYNRSNLGDDAFVDAFKTIFPGCQCVCVDDLKEIPDHVKVLVWGGGDIINPYFLKKAKDLNTKNLPSYAIGVGIPYPSESHLFLQFGHVFVRSVGDAEAALTVLPSEDVTRIPDLTWLLPVPERTVVDYTKKIGLCLAQPAFCKKNPNQKKLLTKLSILLSSLARQGYEVHLLPFNTSKHENESDLILHETLAQSNPDVFCHPQLNRQEMIQCMQSMDCLICMRFHAVQFALQAQQPFVAVHTTRKVGNVMSELGMQEYAYKLPLDGCDNPIDIHVEHVLYLVAKTLTNPNIIQDVPVVPLEDIRNIVFSSKSPVLRFAPDFGANQEKSNALCIEYISNLTGSSTKDINDWMHNVDGHLSIDEIRGAISYDVISRAMCFAMTNHITSQYVWGTTLNIQDPSIKPIEAMNWIFEDHVSRNGKRTVRVPKFDFTPRIKVDLTYFAQDDFAAYHRSGWSYCINGLLHLEASLYENARPDLKIDVYADRSFTWGCDVMQAAGIVPYKSPWAGFIHHTFEEGFGTNNCVSLFKNPVFIESLSSCLCLFVLSNYLAKQISKALQGVGQDHVRVCVVDHAMESVENTWTKEKFLNGPRMVVNVGAWLRDPYAIYALPIRQNERKNPMHIRKAVLKGRDMGAAMEPSWFMPHMEQLQYVDPSVGVGGIISRSECNMSRGEGGMSRGEGCMSRGEGIVSRGYDSTCSKAPIPTNHHVAGIVRMLQQNRESVHIIDMLSNNEYDNLLSENIIFLKFVDLSAANTVLECIVRNTPLIVNRHPALEEVLGENYPGFYEYLEDAADIICNLQKVIEIHNYLSNLEKERFTLATFVRKIHDAIEDIYKTDTAQ